MKRIVSQKTVLSVALLSAGLLVSTWLASGSVLGKTVPASPSHSPASKVKSASQIIFVGPRKNIPIDAPRAYGFWSFALPVTGKLSRSGQPLLSEFRWLKQQGWKSVVDLRVDGERREVSDDRKIAGFNSLGFHYLSLPIRDGSPPTEQQALTFLRFVTAASNQPVHVHCRGGYGRTGTMIALYRYSVQGWSMNQAIQESRLFNGGVSSSQVRWLQRWATTHAADTF